MLMAERPDLIVLGGDYVTWGDRQYVGPGRRGAGAAVAPRTASSPSSAITMTTTTCPRRSRRTASRSSRTRARISRSTARASSSPASAIWTRRPVDIAAVVRGATGPVILLAHDPRRLTEAAALNIPLVLSGHTHGGQVVLPGLGAIAAQKFPVVAGVGRLQTDRDVRESRRRDGVRAGADQLPAGSRGAHVAP